MTVSATKLLATGLLSACVGVSAQATIVEVQTNLGDFEIHLFDHDAAVKPTVTNFLNYVEGVSGHGSYQDTIVHRSVPGFIVQTGGYVFDADDKIDLLQTAPAIQNAPVYSNVRGTVAMAKLGGNQHSATSEWFVSLANNAGNLDKQNGGFTVFGQVTRGMEVVDAIAQLQNVNIGGAFTHLPVQNVSANTEITRDNFVVIENIVVTDSNPDSGASLTLVKNTSINGGSSSSSSSGGSGGSGGAIGVGFIALLLGWFGLALNQRARRQ